MYGLSAKLIVRSNTAAYKTAVRSRLTNVVRDSAYEVASIAYQLCPVDTGFLRTSIAVEQTQGGMQYRVVVGAYYAPFVEYGTIYQAAQPFFRPAIYAVQSRMNRRLGQIQAGLGQSVGVGSTRVRRFV